MTDFDTSPTGKSWDTYWHGTGDVGAFSGGGASHPAVSDFWSDFFRTLKGDYESPQLIDLATGNGAVLEVALGLLETDATTFSCVDVSPAAIENVQQRFPGVTGIVADAAKIPLADGGFDIVTSQFGIEYAGDDALAEAARMVAPGGHLALLLHIEGGSIHKECADSLAAIGKLQASEFVPLAIQMFKNGFEAVRGTDRAPYEAAARMLAPAITALEAIMAEYGEGVAGDTVARLYSDVGRIHSQIQKYEPDEVLGWLNTMDGELVAYAERMSSMLDAGVSKAAFGQLCADLQTAGFSLQRAEPLQTDDQARTLAWVLVANR